MLVNVVNIIPQNKCSATVFCRKRRTFLGKDSFSRLCMSPRHSRGQCLTEAAPSTFPATCEKAQAPTVLKKSTCPHFSRSLFTPTSSGLLERSRMTKTVSALAFSQCRCMDISFPAKRAAQAKRTHRRYSLRGGEAVLWIERSGLKAGFDT